MLKKMEESLPLTLPNSRVAVFGERVKDARTLRGVTAKRLAEELGKTPSSISHLEGTESTELPVAEVRLIADFLGVDEEYLITPPVSYIKNSDLHFRANSTITKKECSSQLSFLKIINEYIVQMVNTRKVELFPVQLENLDYLDDMDNAVLRAREILRLKPGEPIGNLVSLLEKNGVIVVPTVGDLVAHIPNHDAYSSWTSGAGIDVPVIAVRMDTAWERQRLSVAHELGHLLLHRYRAGENKEEEAFDFAIRFLIPSVEIMKEWPDHATPLSLLPLKRKWGVSIAAIARYGRTLGLIDNFRYSSIYRQLSNNKDRATGKSWRVQEPGALERLPEKPRVLAAIVSAVFGLLPSAEVLRSETFLPWDVLRPVFQQLDSPWADALGDDLVAGFQADIVSLDSRRVY
ncbi:helix-turn-helix domain-containing protein [Rothia sp. CCM 9417]|uniref:helix-turn-helix domain-containing protein n=1 Tax=Rothia sp. CCM 9417 TaxID=3402657 RepID=UPI003AECEF7E